MAHCQFSVKFLNHFSELTYQIIHYFPSFKLRIILFLNVYLNLGLQENLDQEYHVCCKLNISSNMVAVPFLAA